MQTNRLCNVCGSSSSHKPQECPSPKVIRTYHGTKTENIAAIANNGLKISPAGRLGPGVYFAELDPATAISYHRGQGSSVAVFECVINTEYCVSETHPPWPGVTNYSFTEWCLKDPTKCAIVAVNMLNGTITENIMNPDISLRVCGNVTFQCSTINISSIVVGGWK